MDRNAVRCPKRQPQRRLWQQEARDFSRVRLHIEEKFHDSYDAMFEVAGIYASNARYEEALERYHKAEEICVTNHKEHICMDHLQAQARIYEIFGKYEDAIKYVELQIKYLEEEWNITEGADVDALQKEKRRLIEKIKQY